MPSKGVLLDLDNTLYSYESAHTPALAAALESLCQQFALPIDTVKPTYSQCRKLINEELHGQAASHSRLLYFQRTLEALKLHPLSAAVTAEESYWSEFLKHMQMREGAFEFLQMLRSNSIPVSIVSDFTARIQLLKLARLGIENYIDAFVSSEEAGKEKPDSAIFKLACKKLGIIPADAVVIGDSLERDVQGAINLGVVCYWLTDGEELSRVPAIANGGKVICFESFVELTATFNS